METTLKEGTVDGGALLMEFFEAAERGDIDTVRALIHPDVVMTWPQSGERFVGRENAISAMVATETKPEPAGEPQVVGSHDVWTMMLPLRYGADVYHYVGVFQLTDGRISRTTEYFGAPFPAQEARAQYAEPSPEG